jgi:hypothetical protein
MERFQPWWKDGVLADIIFCRILQNCTLSPIYLHDLCSVDSVVWRQNYTQFGTRNRIHERPISLRFLGIILRVFRFEVSVWIS